MATSGKRKGPSSARPSQGARKPQEAVTVPTPQRATPARPTVVLVDDHAGSLHLLALEVKEWPDVKRFQLELMTSPRKAIDFIERAYLERRPLFVLCDVRMAGLTGIDVLRAVAGRSTAPFRFILTTAGEHPDLREQAFALGVDDFILKSNQPGVLWETVNGRLNRWLRACETPTSGSAKP